MSDKQINDGGPAFPGVSSSGMTLRDYFASAALNGIIAGKYHVDTMHNPTDKVLLRSVADVAYVLADAMIAARYKKQ